MVLGVSHGIGLDHHVFRVDLRLRYVLQLCGFNSFWLLILSYGILQNYHLRISLLLIRNVPRKKVGLVALVQEGASVLGNVLLQVLQGGHVALGSAQERTLLDGVQRLLLVGAPQALVQGQGVHQRVLLLQVLQFRQRSLVQLVGM